MRLRKSSRITKLILLAVVIYAIVTLVALQPEIDALRDESTKLAEEISALEQSNLELKDDIAALGTDASVLAIAKERLNLVEDGEIVYIDSSK